MDKTEKGQQLAPQTRIPPTTAGRDLDALIAEKVMGDALISRKYLANYDDQKLPRYSTSIADAWSVVEKMRELGFSVIIGTNQCASTQNGVKFYHGWRGLGHSIFEGESHPEPYSVDATVPLAICKAALAVLKSTDFSASPQEEKK